MDDRLMITNKRKKFWEMDTEYGRVTFEDWCKREVKRIGKRVVYMEEYNKCWIQRATLIG